MPRQAPRQDKTSESTVLVVDDDPWMRTAIGAILTDAGYLVNLASNGFTGLRLARELRPHVILLDPDLPELSGAAVLDELRQHPATSDLVVILKLPTADAHDLVAEVHQAVAQRSGPVQGTHDAPVRRRRAAVRAVLV
jgi:CheY-like chemotaxis protein